MMDSSINPTRRSVLKAVGAAAVVSGVQPTARAATESCGPVSRNLSTGVADGTTIEGGSEDDDWRIVLDETESGPVPRPASVVDEGTAEYNWGSTFSGTKWISHSADASVGYSEPTVVYEYCFCLNEGATDPQLALLAQADDEIGDVRINGTSVPYDGAGNYNDAPIEELYTDPSLFEAGDNCVQIQVNDIGGAVSGLNVQAEFEAKNADCACSDDTCPPVEQRPATGYDEDAGTTIAGGSPDDDWEIVTDTTNSGSVPRAATVVNESDADYLWPDPAPGTKWIAHAADGRVDSSGYTVTYEYCFCLNDGFADPELSVIAKSDDEIADLRLNGTSLPYSARGGKTSPIQQTYTDRSVFQAGENCLQIEVRDDGGIVSGLNVDGTVSALDADCDC